MSTWKILKTKEIFTHPRLTLIEDEVVLPSGIETTYLRYKDNGNFAAVIPMREDGRFLVQKEYSHPPAEWIYQFPGGHVPESEDPAVGANRELMEEANYRAQTMQLLGSYLPDHRRYCAKMYVFLATDLVEEEGEADIEEAFQNFWFTESEIDSLIRNGKIVNAPMLAGWMLYKAQKLA
jgi:ADP-ribose pyrophosphatase